jgi:D-alanyl-D-alanine dipeptidase
MQKQIFIGLIILLGTLPSNTIAQTYTKNKYGLEIIDNVENYQLLIEKDSTLKLVPLDQYIDHLKIDFVYATTKNFTHTILYKNPKPYLRLPAAKALRQVAIALKKRGLGIVIFDAYRPYFVTEKMWKVVSDARYAANPKNGSGHNKGISVDLSLYYLSTGKLLQMPTGFDNFTNKASQDYMQLPAAVIENRNILKRVMEQHGFKILSTEWWHFSFPNSNGKYHIINLNFDELARIVKENKN